MFNKLSPNSHMWNMAGIKCDHTGTWPTWKRRGRPGPFTEGSPPLCFQSFLLVWPIRPESEWNLFNVESNQTRCTKKVSPTRSHISNHSDCIAYSEQSLQVVSHLSHESFRAVAALAALNMIPASDKWLEAKELWFFYCVKCETMSPQILPEQT